METYAKDFPFKVGVKLAEFNLRTDGSIKVTIDLQLMRFKHRVMIFGRKGRFIKRLKYGLEERLV